jgi:hypothetical protein
MIDNDSIVKFMREFVLDTVKDTKYSVEDCVENYFINGNFSLYDHIDSWDIRDAVRSYMNDNMHEIVHIDGWDIRDAVRSYMDDNMHEIVHDEMSGQRIEEMVSEYLGNSTAVQDAIDNYDDVEKFLQSPVGREYLADVILTVVFPKISEVMNADKK